MEPSIADPNTPPSVQADRFLTADGELVARIRRKDWSQTPLGPPVEQPRRQGFGSWLIERGLAHELKADARLCYAPSGLVLSLTLPLDGAGRQRVRAGRSKY